MAVARSLFVVLKVGCELVGEGLEGGRLVKEMVRLGIRGLRRNVCRLVGAKALCLWDCWSMVVVGVGPVYLLTSTPAAFRSFSLISS